MVLAKDTCLALLPTLAHSRLQSLSRNWAALPSSSSGFVPKNDLALGQVSVTHSIPWLGGEFGIQDRILLWNFPLKSLSGITHILPSSEFCCGPSCNVLALVCRSGGGGGGGGLLYGRPREVADDRRRTQPIPALRGAPARRLGCCCSSRS